MCTDTSLPLTMINDDDLILLYPQSERERERSHWKNTALHVMRFTLLRHSCTDIEQAVKCWFDVGYDCRQIVFRSNLADNCIGDLEIIGRPRNVWMRGSWSRAACGSEATRPEGKGRQV